MFRKQFMSFMSMAMIFTILLVSCKKDESDVGIDVLPEKYKLQSTNTVLSPNMSTKIGEPVKTDSVPYALLGWYKDPLMGELKASFATQLLISNSTTETEKVAADTVTADALFLYFKLNVDGMYSYVDENKDCTADLMLLNEDLMTSTDYYSDKIPDASFIKSFTFNPGKIIKDAEIEAENKWQEILDGLDDLNDSVNHTKPVPLPLLEIELPNDLCQDIHNYIKLVVNNNETFVQHLKGFYIKPNDASKDNSISFFDYASTETKGVLYYHTESKIDTAIAYNMVMDYTAVHYNIFEHYETPELDNVFYLQGAAGLKQDIFLPELDNYLDDGILWAVNKAELIIHVEDSLENDDYPFPNTLLLQHYNDDGSIATNYDATQYPLSERDYYFTASYGDGKYVFDITIYVQSILENYNNNNGLSLKVSNEAIDPSRVVLANANNSEKIQLKLTLTDLTEN